VLLNTSRRRGAVLIAVVRMLTCIAPRHTSRLHNAITQVYLAMPISTAPRTEELLKELRDTTASIYFVPNIFAFDLEQARGVEINGMPAFSICDSPCKG
jgi:hypothetical protein